MLRVSLIFLIAGILLLVLFNLNVGLGLYILPGIMLSEITLLVSRYCFYGAVISFIIGLSVWMFKKRY